MLTCYYVSTKSKIISYRWALPYVTTILKMCNQNHMKHAFSRRKEALSNHYIKKKKLANIGKYVMISQNHQNIKIP